ncbi:plectin-like [Pollicipes pollicipes]|uniref:plectin-like n=1 Tax=Pollicipes pollicipes TaxID=41117 RepID=UPI0018849513|nr:plectin-like [Pollicipes pollicipes]
MRSQLSATDARPRQAAAVLLFCLLLTSFRAPVSGTPLLSSLQRDGSPHHISDGPLSSTAAGRQEASSRLGGIGRYRRSQPQQSHSATQQLDRELEVAREVRRLEAEERGHQATGAARERAQQQEVAREVQQPTAAPADRTAQQQEITREVKHVVAEVQSGQPHSRSQHEAQEQEIAREIKQAEAEAQSGQGPSDTSLQVAQQQEVAREIKQAEAEAQSGQGSSDTSRQVAQQQEVAREIEQAEAESQNADRSQHGAQQQEIAREVKQVVAEIQSGQSPSALQQEAREREIAGEITQLEAQVHANATDYLSPDTDRSLGDSYSDEDENEDDSEQNDDDRDPHIYDDFFANDDGAVQKKGDHEEASSWNSKDHNAAVDAPETLTSGQTRSVGSHQGQAEIAAGSKGHVKAAAFKSWQATTMTVVMCAVIGLVLLTVVGVWFRHFSPESPKPQNLLLEDDENTVYNNTTSTRPAGPHQVGRYARLT